LFNNAVQAQGQGQPPVEAGGGAPEIIKHKTNPQEAGTGFLTAGGTASLSAISYHGGPLIPTPTAYLIWYGNWAQSNGTDNASGQQIVRDFLSNVGGSPYYMVNTTYSAGGYTISGGVNYGSDTATTGYPQGTRLSDADIQTIVNNAITSGRLPYNANGVYFVLTSSDVTERSGFCTRYCGWHTAGTPSAGHVRYSFVGNAARCLNSCAAQTIGPNGNAGVDAMLSVVAHELEEANTDPDPSSGWVDSSGAENADKCAWTFGSRQLTAANGAIYNMTLGSRNYLIQRNLSATDNKCYIDWPNRVQ
jgi:hypothetical protein